MLTPLTQVSIDLNAVAGNIRELRAVTRSEARIMAVVKADGYGHGAVKTAQTALENGADALGVARIEEGLVLRQSGISAPVLIFGFIPEDNMGKLIEFDLTATAYSIDSAQALSRTAVLAGSSLRIHIKVDTGMGRIGFLPDHRRFPNTGACNLSALVSDIEAVLRLPGLMPEGIFTHFSASDQHDKSFSESQLSLFLELLDTLKKRGVEFSIRHAANSAGVISMPESHLDMVRPGIAIYGLYPSDEVDRSRITLVPAMSLKTHVMQLKKVPAHFAVSYGYRQETLKPSVIATVPIGYADGFSRLNSCTGMMLVRGRVAPVIGRVCMDLTMLDVGHIPEVMLHDEVVVFGRQGGMARTADDLARDLGTINYEIVTSVSNRIPRIYGNSLRDSISVGGLPARDL
jgi:alanine racemase